MHIFANLLILAVSINCNQVIQAGWQRANPQSKQFQAHKMRREQFTPVEPLQQPPVIPHPYSHMRDYYPYSFPQQMNNNYVPMMDEQYPQLQLPQQQYSQQFTPQMRFLAPHRQSLPEMQYSSQMQIPHNIQRQYPPVPNVFNYQYPLNHEQRNPLTTNPTPQRAVEQQQQSAENLINDEEPPKPPSSDQKLPSTLKPKDLGNIFKNLVKKKASEFIKKGIASGSKAINKKFGNKM